jgi:hypothetical protein
MKTFCYGLSEMHTANKINEKVSYEKLFGNY